MCATMTVQARIEESLRTYKAHIASKRGEDVDVFDAMMLSAALGRRGPGVRRGPSTTRP